jgi:hypothetical protein
MRVLVAYEETYSFYRSVITRAIEYHRPHLQVRSVALEVFQETLAVRRARVAPGCRSRRSPYTSPRGRSRRAAGSQRPSGSLTHIPDRSPRSACLRYRTSRRGCRRLCDA